jgi:hypothetical protein
VKYIPGLCFAWLFFAGAFKLLAPANAVSEWLTWWFAFAPLLGLWLVFAGIITSLVLLGLVVKALE